MTTQTEALKLALDYIIATNKSSQFWLVPESNLNKTVTAIKEALAHSEQICGFDVVIDESMPPNTFKLAQPEQEPVAIQYASKAERDLYEMEDKDDTTPPQRTWVDMTD